MILRFNGVKIQKTGQEYVDSREDFPYQIPKILWNDIDENSAALVLKETNDQWDWKECWRDLGTTQYGGRSPFCLVSRALPGYMLAPTVFSCDSGRNPAVANCGDWWPSSGQWEVQANPPGDSGKPQPFCSWTGLGLKVTFETVAVVQSGIGGLFVRMSSVVKGSPAITIFKKLCYCCSGTFVCIYPSP